MTSSRGSMPSGPMELINDRDDLEWVRDVVLNGVPNVPTFRSALIIGRDPVFADEVRLYGSVNPDDDETPLARYVRDRQTMTGGLVRVTGSRRSFGNAKAASKSASMKPRTPAAVRPRVDASTGGTTWEAQRRRSGRMGPWTIRQMVNQRREKRDAEAVANVDFGVRPTRPVTLTVGVDDFHPMKHWEQPLLGVRRDGFVDRASVPDAPPEKLVRAVGTALKVDVDSTLCSGGCFGTVFLSKDGESVVKLTGDYIEAAVSLWIMRGARQRGTALGDLCRSTFPYIMDVRCLQGPMLTKWMQGIDARNRQGGRDFTWLRDDMTPAEASSKNVARMYAILREDLGPRKKVSEIVRDIASPHERANAEIALSELNRRIMDFGNMSCRAAMEPRAEEANAFSDRKTLRNEMKTLITATRAVVAGFTKSNDPASLAAGQQAVWVLGLLVNLSKLALQFNAGFTDLHSGNLRMKVRPTVVRDPKGPPPGEWAQPGQPIISDYGMGGVKTSAKVKRYLTNPGFAATLENPPPLYLP